MRDIDKAINALDKQVWALHKKLGEAYDSTFAVYRDMAKLGKMARQMLKLLDARAVMNVIELGTKTETKE